jgi:oxygen-independent coproporphyrinogen-3 oxidase
LPDGDPAPADGSLPVSATVNVHATPFGAYVHVPFCASRCGYCDFNTYTASELGGMSQTSYLDAVAAEVRLARDVVAEGPPLATIFFGGGTPTLLEAADQVAIVHLLAEAFGLSDDCEVTTEANPESVSPTQLQQLRDGGINRISFGMQSAVSGVLHTLDRHHTHGRVESAISDARKAGFDNISLDLIYGTPGESLADWEQTLKAALDLKPDHISAYALIVEPGTSLARRIARGELADTDDDDQADKYERADQLLAASGLQWYEVSNWARSERFQSRHNVGYWRGHNWWGLGPGAHSHVGGVRWWNVKHPREYVTQLMSGRSPAAARETLSGETQRVERVLLELRLRDGLSLDVLTPPASADAAALVDEGLLERTAWSTGRVQLTLRGRLLADLVVRRLSFGDSR